MNDRYDDEAQMAELKNWREDNGAYMQECMWDVVRELILYAFGWTAYISFMNVVFG